MKKILFLLFLLSGMINANAQVTKANVEKILEAFPFSGFEKIYINNSRLFYNDGSSKIEQTYYDAKICKIEISETGIYIYKYKDAAKADLSSVAFYSFSAIEVVSASSKSMTITLPK